MDIKIIRVLLVESDPVSCRVLKECLAALTTARIELVASATLEDALRQLHSGRFDAALLNLQLPDSRGLNTFARVCARAPALPIVILTSCDCESLALEAVRQGAQDYLVKSKVDGKILTRVIRYAIERKRVERRLTAQHAVASALAESTTLHEAAPRILKSVCESLEWEMGILWRADPRTKLLRCAGVWQAPGLPSVAFASPGPACAFAKGAGLPGRVWESGKPAWSQPASEEDSVAEAEVDRGGLRTTLGFPVRVDRQILGVLEFFCLQAQQPEPDVLRMMALIGSQTGQFMIRKEAEEALAEERNLLRTLIDTLPDAIYVKDPQSRFLLANQAVALLTGASHAESLVGKTDADLFPPELAGRYLADEKVLLNSGEPLINREEPVVDAAGRQGWLLTTKTPLRDIRGRIIGLVGVGRDITERRREEERHRLSEARLLAFLDNTTAVIYLKDLQGRYLLVNRQFEELFHISRDQVAEKTDHDLFPPRLARAFQANDRQVLETRTPLEFEEVASRDGELRTYISIKFPLCDTAGVPYAVCGISTDITERKRAETELVNANANLRVMNEELARSEEALREALAELQTSHAQLKAAQLRLIQAEKMESIGTLAAGVAHEVKNPLQTILMGLAYLSKALPPTNDNVALALTDMREAVKRANAIVRDLLYLSAAKQLEMEDGDLNAVIEHSLRLVNYELTRGRIQVERNLASGLPSVRLDKAKIEQVFLNLFLNAIQAMPGGGTLTVRTSVAPLNRGGDAPPNGNPRSEGDGCWVLAEILDTGAGIPEEKLARIFEPFFTTKPNGVGTGLGLPVTRQIVELHGGAIDIQPAPAGGVRVSLMLRTQDETGHEKN